MTEKHQERDIASREEALELLTQRAREGSTTAAAALARELRQRERDDRPLDDELERLLHDERD